jgi:FxsC-like protein
VPVINALSTAEVLVPLFSPRYIRWAWTKGEHNSFQQRIGFGNGAHIQPVHWVPLLPDDQVPSGTDLAGLGHGIPAYTTDGLRAMLRQEQYREAYETIVDRLARRIVAVAETAPIGPSPAPPILDVITPLDEARFVVAVLAPTLDRMPPGRDADTYGRNVRAWRPFASETTPAVAQQAADVAERLGLATAIVEAPEDMAALAAKPTIMLIDPWIIDAPGGRNQLESAVDGMNEWTKATIVVDPTDAQFVGRGAELVATVNDILMKASGSRRPLQVQRADEFDEELPEVITQTRKRFLRHIPARYPARESLTGPYPDRSTGSGDAAR